MAGLASAFSDPQSSGPLVFLSHSREDIQWRDLMLQELWFVRGRSDDFELWHESVGIDLKLGVAESAKSAMQRACLAVVFLSPDYIHSPLKVAECKALMEDVESEECPVYFVVARECLWANVLPEIRRDQIFGGDRPLGGLPEGEAKGQMRMMARVLSAQLDLAVKRLSVGKVAMTSEKGAVGEINSPKTAAVPLKKETVRITLRGRPKIASASTTDIASPRARNPRAVAGESSKKTTAPVQLPSAPLPPPPRYQFSKSALRIVTLAREFGMKTGRGRLTSSCLFFALTESSESSASGRFLRNTFPHEQYRVEFQDFLNSRLDKPWPETFDDLPWNNVSENVRRVLTFANEIVQKVSPRAQIICTRHILAGLLMRLKGEDYAMGVEIPVLRQEFREFICWKVAGDAPRAWDEVLEISSQQRWGAWDAQEHLEVDSPARSFVLDTCRLAGRLDQAGNSLLAVAFLVREKGGEKGWAANALEEALREDRALCGEEASVSREALLDLPEGSFGPLAGEGTLESWITEDLSEVLKSTHCVVRRMGKDGYLRYRVFLAVILAKNPPIEYAAMTSLRSLGYDVDFIRAHYRRFLEWQRPQDPPKIYDELLGTVKEAEAVLARRQEEADVDGIQAEATVGEADTETVTPQAVEVNAFRKSYAYFAPDHSDGDELRMGTYAEHLAKLIAAEATAMPLSIGLFGRWGSGKSHFMKLLELALADLTKKEGKTFHKHIVQIRFNAWHYLDTSLWASLVCEIFDQLFKKLERKPGAEEQVKKLKEELKLQGSLAVDANQALDTAKKKREEAEGQLEVAQREVEAKGNEVRSFARDIQTLITEDDGGRQQLGEVADLLGMPALAGSAAELEKQVDEMRSFGGQVRHVYDSMRKSPWLSLLLALGVALLPVGIAGLVALVKEPGWLRDFVTGAKTLLQASAALLGVAAAWMARWLKVGRPWLAKVESAHQKLQAIRAKNQSTDAKVQKAQAALVAAKQAEDEAARRAAEALAKIQVLDEQIAELAPGRVIMRFVTERAGTGDYRKHLGLVSLIRRDFQQLSDLLAPRKGEQTDEDAKHPEGELPKIERIVLYIDDLDRCSSRRVIEVLEAVHLLLAFPLFTVVVAVDPRWLRQSLLDRYSRLLGARNGNGRAEGQEQEEGRRHSPPSATPQDYLEKIFQVPFNLRPMEKDGFDGLVDKLFVCEDPAKAQELSAEAGNQQASAVARPEAEGEKPVTPAAELAGENARNDMPAMGTKDDTAGAAPEGEPQDPLAANAAGGGGEALKAEAGGQKAIATPEEEKAQAAESKKSEELAEQRLLLKAKERADVKLFLPLFSTPRAVKRMSNTYALIRVGVDEKKWDIFIGPGDTAGEYRVPMLMLAVASGFPSLAGSWLQWLQEAAPDRWTLKEEEVDTLAHRFEYAGNREEWGRLKKALDEMEGNSAWPQGWPPPSSERLRTWAPSVARYSF